MVNRSTHPVVRFDRRGELRFEIEVTPRDSEFVAEITRAVRIHAGYVPCLLNHVFAEQHESTEKEALEQATGEIDRWIPGISHVTIADADGVPIIERRFQAALAEVWRGMAEPPARPEGLHESAGSSASGPSS